MTTINYNRVDHLLVPHLAFGMAKARLLQAYKASISCIEPICIVIFGESRVGKTRLLENLVLEHPPERTEEGMLIPILKVSTPSRPTVKGLVETMLKAMGDPLCYKKASEIEKTERLIKLLSKTKTTMLIIDEFQHFNDKTSNKIQHHLADWLKILVDRTHIALVVAGLESGTAVISRNEQLSGRFAGMIRLTRLDWRDPHSRGEFCSILEGFQNGLAGIDMPDLANEKMAFRFYCATGGLIGYVAKILRFALWKAIDEGRTIISLDDLAEAFKDAIWQSKNTFINPFDNSFNTHSTDFFLNQANIIGKAELPDTEVPSRKKFLPKPTSALDALTIGGS